MALKYAFGLNTFFVSYNWSSCYFKNCKFYADLKMFVYLSDKMLLKKLTGTKRAKDALLLL